MPVPESVEVWWSRRRWSKDAQTPYPIGQFRLDWERYPVLIRQYHPDLNHGITLTQIPPAADVYLVWECDAGHRFVATPMEQRQRPTGSRRRSTWCPDCAALAVRRRAPRAAPAAAGAAGAARTGRPRSASPRGAATPAVTNGPVGEAFHSAVAPVPASAAEAELRQRLAAVLTADFSFNAVRVGRPFFGRLEVWPDFALDELRVAIEYDTTGRDGLEHVGRREQIDRRKDRLLRAAGWEVVRIRCCKLQPIGEYDLIASGVSAALIERLLDTLRRIRGDLIVNAYLR
jgi:very-short-patch-repair endonuclease